ncbi:xanthine dehydrogenase family protein molybdopterin-binding subunit [Variovorax paradoxus]|nr:molybdopterin cofactor-binding domain-containing protein [Variovorax paradoxus]MBT2305090.1 xanthine dehydrogenase family protein molybdopterin-binding subunit [Variovorax paradoxus]
MSNTEQSRPTRRGFLTAASASAGALVVGYWYPSRAVAQQGAKLQGASGGAEQPADREVNAWVVVHPDETVTIRIAQTELGQGTWTSCAMMICEELQCDWTKVRPEYASVNRDARERAPEWTLNAFGGGARDPNGAGGPLFYARDPRGVLGIPDSLYRRMRTNAGASVRDTRYYHQLAGAEARERLLLAAASLFNVPVQELRCNQGVITHLPTGRTTTYGKVASLAAGTPHPNPRGIRIKPPAEWTLMGTEQKNLDVPDKVSGKTVFGIDVKLPGMKWVAVKSCPVYGGKVKSYDFEKIRKEPGVISAVEFPIPDPSLIRGRVFGGGVAVIADHWYQARNAIEKMPIEWDVPAANAARNTQNIHASLLGALDKGGKVQTNIGDCAKVFASGAKVIEAVYTTPYLPRARMEPGNATVLVTDDRADIWIGDQSPQETRYSVSQITGIPEKNVHVHLCHLGGGFGRNGNGPQAEQAVYVANKNRGTPIHLLWTREEDFINTTYRPMGVARLKAAVDADGWPVAFEVRTAMDKEAIGGLVGFHIAPRYFAPNYRFTTHDEVLHIPVGTRRGVGAPSNDFYRESFIDELAHAAGKDPYLYRRELLARSNMPYKDVMIKALDLAAKMSNWGSPLPKGTARAIALEEYHPTEGRVDSIVGGLDRHATISAVVHTVSISQKGELRLLRSDIALDEGFGLVNPLTVRKQLEGQVAWFYNDVMHQKTSIADGHVVENNFHTFPLSRLNEDPLEINIQFFKSDHWISGVGHDRCTSVQSCIADAVFQITGKRYRELPLRDADLSWS